MDVKNDLEEIKSLTNEVAKEANKQRKEYLDKISLYKLIIICITFCFIIACSFMYMASVKKAEALKDLFYDMQVEDTTEIEQNTGNNSGSNYYVNGDNNSNVGD